MPGNNRVRNKTCRARAPPPHARGSSYLPAHSCGAPRKVFPHRTPRFPCGWPRLRTRPHGCRSSDPRASRGRRLRTSRLPTPSVREKRAPTPIARRCGHTTAARRPCAQDQAGYPAHGGSGRYPTSSHRCKTAAHLRGRSGRSRCNTARIPTGRPSVHTYGKARYRISGVPGRFRPPRVCARAPFPKCPGSAS